MKKLKFPARAVKNRKAQADTQLNWIFIMIVGAIIMAFFIFIVMKQRAASEAKFSGKVAQQLNTILVGAKVSSGTVQEIPTPEISVRFTCNDYYVGASSQRLGNRVVFAPEYLDGNRMITWTLDWNVPFKVTSFLYITSPFIRYIVVGDDDFAKELFASLPQKLNKKMFSTGDYPAAIRNEGDKAVRFIFVNAGSQSMIPPGFENVGVSGIIVSGSTSSSGGEVQFLMRSAADPTSFTVLGDSKFQELETLYGAIFSEKSEDYDCLMKRAYSRLNMVANVYLEKFNEIAGMYEYGNCVGFYRANPELTAIAGATQAYPPVYTTIASSASGLIRTNTQLQLQSCPLIY